MSLDPAIEDALEGGQLGRFDLIRFDLPGKSVGYHRGARPLLFNGMTYQPNKWLEMGELSGELGVAVTARTIVFSGVPTENADDAIAALESYDYTNAPVIISHLAVDIESGEVLGLLASSIYEINEVSYEQGAAGADGARSLTVSIELEPPGRSARGQTSVKRSPAEQQFDNDPNDTSLEYVATSTRWPERWGQQGG
ncbi:DUF2163 domain-containing protein [Georhizobium profundi]|jgi:hypothetical protein|uniref:DUF2163 domain-containing protein n=1 Tax=Georhizobium profundi TaxID=2341112 RepID=A0A3Q8XQ14_9HYPH|nr:DUF2163 domain-containing protein [Georhizobium profundi]AZN72736.1 DUF2163 domain-containing protein [Georhizobium profundi]